MVEFDFFVVRHNLSLPVASLIIIENAVVLCKMYTAHHISCVYLQAGTEAVSCDSAVLLHGGQQSVVVVISVVVVVDRS